MKRPAFESLLFVDVEDRAAVELAPQVDKPKYFGRPWSHLRDEMIANGSSTVAELPANQIESFYRSTQSSKSAKRMFSRGLFRGNSR
jgi:hypothetical protein